MNTHRTQSSISYTTAAKIDWIVPIIKGRSNAPFSFMDIMRIPKPA